MISLKTYSGILSDYVCVQSSGKLTNIHNYINHEIVLNKLYKCYTMLEFRVTQCSTMQLYYFCFLFFYPITNLSYSNGFNGTSLLIYSNKITYY